MAAEADGSRQPHLQLFFSPTPHLHSNLATEQRVVDNAGEDLGAEEFGREPLRRAPCSYQHPREDTVDSVPVPGPVSSPGQESEIYICRDEWNDAATFALLEAWGAKFLRLRRGSLKLEDWAEVAEVVSAVSKDRKTDVQCKNRLDSLKKLFKHEKYKWSEVGSTRSTWPSYKHLEWMLSNAPRWTGLPGAVDAGQILVGPTRNKNCAHLEGKLRLFSDTSAMSKAAHCRERSCDSPTLSPAGAISGDKPPRKRRCKEAPLESLVKAISRFVEVYEKIEQSKQKQLVDLERVRMEFTKNLELQRLQLFMQARLELARMKHGNIDFNASISNMTG